MILTYWRERPIVWVNNFLTLNLLLGPYCYYISSCSFRPLYQTIERIWNSASFTLRCCAACRLEKRVLFVWSRKADCEPRAGPRTGPCRRSAHAVFMTEPHRNTFCLPSRYTPHSHMHYKIGMSFPQVGIDHTILVAICKPCAVLSKTAAKSYCGLFRTPLLFSSTMKVATFSSQSQE